MSRAFFRAVARGCLASPVRVLLFALLLSLLCAAYTLQRLSFSTDRTDMLNAQAPVQKSWRSFMADFGHKIDFVVLALGSSQDCEQALDDLGRRLAAEPLRFDDVFYRLDLPEMPRSSLYYLSLPDLDRLTRVVDVARPWLASLSGPAGVAGLLQSMATDDARVTVRRLTPALALINKVLLELLGSLESRGREPYQSPIGQFRPDLEMLKGKSLRPGQTTFYNVLADGQTYILLCCAHQQVGSFSADVANVARLRELVREVGRRHSGVSLLVTGEPVINTDEMLGAQWDALLSGLLALALVTALLIGFLGSILEPLAIILSLLLAFTWSAAFAAGSVGQLNLLTVNFGTILVGLGMTFGIQLLFRYQEERSAGHNLEQAIHSTVEDSGQENLVGAATTGVAFWALYFTSFRSAAELGLIAGTGVLLCFLSMVTVLPSLLVLIDRYRGGSSPNRPSLAWMKRLDHHLLRRPGAVLFFSLACSLYSLSWLVRIPFDYNLLNMQPVHSEAIRVERLLQSVGYSSLSAVSVSPDIADALRKTSQLRGQQVVSQVESVVSLLPSNVSAKRPLVREIVRLAKTMRVPPILPALGGQQLLQLYQQYKVLRNRLRSALPLWRSGPDRLEAAQLGRLLTRLDESLDLNNPGPVEDGLGYFVASLAADLKAQVLFLRQQEAQPMDVMTQLPKSLRSRSVSPGGKFQLRIFPRYDIWQREPLERFVKVLERIDPQITGGPILIFYYLEELRTAYVVSARNALMVICGLLLWHFRSLGKAALALLPKMLGMLWVIGIMGVFQVNFNPANFMALPLTLGIGLIFGVHVLQNLLTRPHSSLFDNSTGPAIVLSALTSIVGFGTLLIANHRGIASFGFVMAMGVAANLLTSVIVLPAVMTLIGRLGSGWPRPGAPDC